MEVRVKKDSEGEQHAFMTKETVERNATSRKSTVKIEKRKIQKRRVPSQRVGGATE